MGKRGAPPSSITQTAESRSLVLEGRFNEGNEEFTRQSWLRLPAGSDLQADAGPEGCRVWVKTGHLL